MAQRTTDDEVAKFDNPLAIGDAVGLALHRHRIASGLSIRELGREAGISSAMISRLEGSRHENYAQRDLPFHYCNAQAADIAKLYMLRSRLRCPRWKHWPRQRAVCGRL